MRNCPAGKLVGGVAVTDACLGSPLDMLWRVVAPIGTGRLHVTVEVLGKIGKTVLAQAVFGAFHACPEQHGLWRVETSTPLSKALVVAACDVKTILERCGSWNRIITSVCHCTPIILHPLVSGLGGTGKWPEFVNEAVEFVLLFGR